MPGVDQRHLQGLDFTQGMEDQLPVHPGGLHPHVGDALLDQPPDHLPQHLIEGLVLADLLMPFPRAFPGHTHRHRDLSLAHIDRRDPRIHDLHNGPLPLATDPTRRPRILHEDQDSETRAQRQQPGVPNRGRTQRQSEGRTRRYQEQATSAGDPPSFTHPGRRVTSTMKI